MQSKRFGEFGCCIGTELSSNNIDDGTYYVAPVVPAAPVTIVPPTPQSSFLSAFAIKALEDIALGVFA